MAAVATSSGMGASVVGHKAVMPATKTTSQWDTKRHIAFSHVAHLGVDSVLFALVRRHPDQEQAPQTYFHVVI